ncbi:hypothetical protein UO65_6349 [Actinokineospora spheciospongiae]|uniref:Uncharacterized protein n=1 Tax=Actinokineospora spheciospongiae TaxID=909613 RepID=W7INW9_9PSEU|nr:hypothetical protein [Actinokineospora spheciospongiae]EWC58457.1 hypothetical protein UO65_6349 [Actinokineospora spheciospongiae]
MDDRRTLHLTFAPEVLGAPEPDRKTEPARTAATDTAETDTAPADTAPDQADTAAADTGRATADLPAPRRTPRDRLLVLAEHLVGSWASTLRMALAMLACMVGALVLIALATGPLPALIGAGALAAVISTTRNR